MVISSASEGLRFSNVGGCGRFLGRSASAELIAVCTSTAAESTLRDRSNSTVIELAPRELVDEIDTTPGRNASALSRGEVTEAATVSALAPGSVVDTEML